MPRSIAELFPTPPTNVTVTAESVIGLSTLLSAKQNVLTAGANVAIQNGVISADVQAAVQSVNGRIGDVTITANSLGAETAGAAAAEINAHNNSSDPHPQYVNQVRGDARYLRGVVSDVPPENPSASILWFDTSTP